MSLYSLLGPNLVSFVHRLGLGGLVENVWAASIGWNTLETTAILLIRLCRCVRNDPCTLNLVSALPFFVSQKDPTFSFTHFSDVCVLVEVGRIVTRIVVFIHFP